MALKAEDIKRVKGEGFLLNRGTQCFNGRIITENGTLTARQLIRVRRNSARGRLRLLPA